jgi:hypothetical protein
LIDAALKNGEPIPGTTASILRQLEATFANLVRTGCASACGTVKGVFIVP